MPNNAMFFSKTRFSYKKSVPLRAFSLSESRESLLTLPSAEPTNERMESRVYLSFSERGGGRQSQKVG